MNQLNLEKDVIIKRIEGIEAELIELKKLGAQELPEFTGGYGWKLAQFHLHRALEGVFNISSHILSRIPGATATQYKEIALKMGEYKLVSDEFAKTELVEMAKYRNRLVHFYAEISAEELYKIIQENLGDFEVFLKFVKDVLSSPSKFNLTIE